MALATVAAAVAFAVYLGRSSRLALFLAAATGVAFLPVSNLLFPTGTIMAERLLYLPSIGVIACVTVAFEKVGSGKVLRFALALLVVVLAVGTWMRNPVWRSELSLWTSAVAAAPGSFKVHSSLAEALYQADPSRTALPDAAAAADRSIAILDTLPADRRAARVYRQAASYHFEHGDLLDRRGSASEAAMAYRRAADLLERYLALLGDGPSFAADRADAERMRSAALLLLDERAEAVDAVRLALEREPFNADNYRAAAAALIQARRLDEAAVMLTTGVMLTGNADLRAASLDLYRSGLDAEGCAVAMTAGVAVLNPDCPVVKRHICAAGVAAMAAQRAAGRAELAEVIQKSVIVAYGCQ